MCRLSLFLPLLLAISLITFAQFHPGQPDTPQIQLTGNTIADAQNLVEQGLHRDAYDLVRPWLLDHNNGNHVDFAEALRTAVQALQRLNRVRELDELLESAVEAQKHRWRAIIAIAEQYRSIPKVGTPLQLNPISKRGQ